MNNSQMDPAAMKALMAGMGVFLFIAVAVGLAIAVYICWLLVKDYERVPANFRTMEPWKVWLNLIPCVAIVWNFWVFPGLAKSYKAYFDSVGDTSVGDCGEKIGLWYAICCCCSIIPVLGSLAGIAALVLLIMFLIKANDLKKRIPESAV